MRASLAGEENAPPLFAVLVISCTVVFKRNIGVGSGKIENILGVSGGITLGLHASGKARELVVQWDIVLQLISGLDEGSRQSSFNMPLNMATISKR